MKYDIFISYRREGGEYTAKIIHDKLTEMGYKVFFDVESLRSGQFNNKLFSVIDECKDFISILSPNSLDRCENDDDWVRLEVAHALKQNKNVIPVLLRGFKFPDQLPENINQLRYQSGIEASTEFFDAFAGRLAEFLKSKPQIINRISQNTLIKKVLPLTLAFFIVAGVIFSGFKIYEYQHAIYPVTKKDKNLVSEVIYYISENLAYINIALMEYDNSINSCYEYLDNPNDTNYLTLQTDLTYRKEKITEAKNNLVELKDSLSSKLDQTDQLSKKDIIAVKDYFATNIDEMLNNIDFMSMLADDTMLSKTTKTQLLDHYKELIEIDKNLIFYGANDILAGVSKEALKEFKTEILPTVPYIYDGQEWREDKEEIKSITDTEFAKYQNVLTDISSIVGNENVKTDELETQVNELQEATEELEALKEKAKDKFKPLETDDINTLWGKACRFNSLKMYDMCIECLTIFQDKVELTEAKTFVPILIEFYKQVGNTGIDYGCLVGGYEPDKPKNEFYQIGDILIDINGYQIKNSIDFAATEEERKSNYHVKVLRFNGAGFEIVEGEIKYDAPIVYFYDIVELPEE